VIPIDTMLKDPTLAPQGRRKVDFAASRMPVLAAVAAELARTRPLEGMRIAACLHVTTETGNRDAITLEHLTAMKPGAIVCNAGHFDVDVDVAGLRWAATDATEVRPNAIAYTLPGGGRVIVLADGRLVGQSCAEASPAEVMDLTFATQALAVQHLAAAAATLGPGVHPVPAGIEGQVARHKLAALGVRCDDLTAEQEAYLRDWRIGS